MKKMVRGFLTEVFFFVVLFVFPLFSLGGVVSVCGAYEDIQGGAITAVKELEYEELFDWLAGLEASGVISGEEFEDILDRATTKPGPYTLTTTTVTICGKRGMTGPTCASGTPSTSCSSLWSSAGTVSTGNPILITASGTIVYDTAGNSTKPAGSGSGCGSNYPLFCATAHSLSI